MNGRAVVAALVLIGSGVFASTAGAPAAQAAAGGDNCVSGGSGGTSGGGGGSVSLNGQITMWAALSEHTQAALCPGGTSSGGNSNWTPPQCWWGPEYSPDQLAADIGQLDTNGGSADATYTALTDEYANGGTGAKFTSGYMSTDGPKWELFNVGASPGGEWWGLIWNENITPQGMNDCTNIDTKHFPEDWYWVADQAGAPNPGDAPVVDAHELALYLEGKVKLTPLPIQTDPALTTTKATVGLPTWVWANAGGATVLDQLCLAPQYGANICVNMTATARSFTVSSSDSGATLYTDCKANAGGTVGTPYTGQSGNPPCGVTFSQPGNWTLDMVTTWNVKLDYGNGELDDPAYTETDLNANVQEVQAINNGGATTAAAP
jgi:enoyl reductase